MPKLPSAGVLLALLLSGAGCGLQVLTATQPRTSPTISRTDTDGTRGSASSVLPPGANPSPSPHAVALRVEGREHLKAGRLDDAIRTLESAYRVDTGDAESTRLLCEAYNQRAVARYSDDHLADAIADLRRSLELDPSQSEIRMQLTRAQARLERLNAIGRHDEPEH